MLLLGHMGITLAAARILDYTVSRKKIKSTQAVQDTEGDDKGESDKSRPSLGIDLRLLLIGSMLPDIIDKPLGHIILQNNLDNGRIYSHTLLFTVILTLAAFYLWKYKDKAWLFSLVLGVVMHLVLDEMWLMYHTLLWPLFGWSFPRGHYDSYLREMFEYLLSNPKLIVTEIAGGLVLLWYALVILRKKMVRNFLKTGHLQ